MNLFKKIRDWWQMRKLVGELAIAQVRQDSEKQEEVEDKIVNEVAENGSRD